MLLYCLSKFFLSTKLKLFFINLKTVSIKLNMVSIVKADISIVILITYKNQLVYFKFIYLLVICLTRHPEFSKNSSRKFLSTYLDCFKYFFCPFWWLLSTRSFCDWLMKIRTAAVVPNCNLNFFLT